MNYKKDGNIIIFHRKRDENDAFDGRSFLEKSRMKLNDNGPITTYKEYYSLEEVKQLAEEGNPDAQYSLGQYYHNQPDEPIDIKLAKEWLTKAADQDHIEAQYSLGCMFYAGQGVRKDYKKAVTWLQKAAEQGHMYAQSVLAGIYRKGTGRIKKDSILALKWYTESAKQGYALDQCSVSEMYEKGEGTEVDYEKSFEWALKAALNGFAPSQCKIGNYYRLGLGVEKDFDKAYYWLIKAAKQDYWDALTGIGLLYMIGSDSINRDINRAQRWFTRAISFYDDFAVMISEYISIYSGKYVYDLKRFKKWLFAKAASGNRTAGEAILSSYLYGYVTPIDNKKSRNWEKRLSLD